MASAQHNAFEILVSARRVADYAVADGVSSDSGSARVLCNHLGAVLADSVLQAGLNYGSVVRPRVFRIFRDFSYADTMKQLLPIVQAGGSANFLNWHHKTKVQRFENLATALNDFGINTTDDLRRCISDDCFGEALQHINGIGPKTVDYMACLVGVDSVAVDRHIRSYARRAGVDATEYYFLKKVFCNAADFLDVRRRDFDAWIWKKESAKQSTQMSFDLS